jgi:hypothetical protein
MGFQRLLEYLLLKFKIKWLQLQQAVADNLLWVLAGNHPSALTEHLHRRITFGWEALHLHVLDLVRTLSQSNSV